MIAKELVDELYNLYKPTLSLGEYMRFFEVLDQLSELDNSILDVVTELKNRILNTGVERIRTLENSYYFYKMPKMNDEEESVKIYLNASLSYVISEIQRIYNGNIQKVT